MRNNKPFKDDPELSVYRRISFFGCAAISLVAIFTGHTIVAAIFLSTTAIILASLDYKPINNV